MIKRKISILSIAIVILLSLVAFTEMFMKKNEGENIRFLKQSAYQTVNFNESWKQFSRKIKVSKEKTKIEDFDLILDKSNHIHAIKFNLIDQSGDQFTHIQYQQCFICENKKQHKIMIFKDKTTDGLKYPHLIKAIDFFSKIDLLKQSNSMSAERQAYSIVHSSGMREAVGIEGNYYELVNTHLKKINKNTLNTKYHGFNLQVFRSNSLKLYESNPYSTTIFLANYE